MNRLNELMDTFEANVDGLKYPEIVELYRKGGEISTLKSLIDNIDYHRANAIVGEYLLLPIAKSSSSVKSASESPSGPSSKVEYISTRTGHFKLYRTGVIDVYIMGLKGYAGKVKSRAKKFKISTAKEGDDYLRIDPSGLDFKSFEKLILSLVEIK